MARLRQSISSLRAGDEDADDAERLSVDPVIRLGGVGRAALAGKRAALTCTAGRFETEIFTPAV